MNSKQKRRAEKLKKEAKSMNEWEHRGTAWGVRRHPLPLVRNDGKPKRVRSKQDKETKFNKDSEQTAQKLTMRQFLNQFSGNKNAPIENEFVFNRSINKDTHGGIARGGDELNEAIRRGQTSLLTRKTRAKVSFSDIPGPLEVSENNVTDHSIRLPARFISADHARNSNAVM